MESRSGSHKGGFATDKVVRATELIRTRGRAYYTRRGQSISLQVFAKNLLDCTCLTDVLGGGYYKHKQGWIWAMGKKKDLLVVVEKVFQTEPTLDEWRRLKPLLQFAGKVVVSDTETGVSNDEGDDSRNLSRSI